MKYLLGSLVVCSFYLIIGLFNYRVLRLAHAAWLRSRPVRTAAWVLPVAGAISGIGWFNSFGLHPVWAECLGTAAFGLFLVHLVLAGSLVLTGGMRGVRRFLARQRRPEPPIDSLRRRLWQGGLAAIPLLATGTSLVGIGGAAAAVRIPHLSLNFADLPPDLAGLRVLHLSDLHLAGFVSLETLDDILSRARDLSPDLIVVTGDVADDYRLFPGAFQRLANFGAPLGVYAVLGNHEYGNGVKQAEAFYADSGVRLLVDQGVVIRRGTARLHLGGVDDPANGAMARELDEFYAPRVGKIFPNQLSGDFRLLLSHRPTAFDAAAARSVHLTLAGHTHGGQIGFDGQSILRMSSVHPYPWGRYRIAASQLYTSAGAGHWVPFRLGCPAEAPLIELMPG